ncbi:hypothetical protein J6590_087806 [Homalodisca vitripennis]|nr:hypothetical protein J6590_087806 [Homalodisca vitripennis]
MADLNPQESCRDAFKNLGILTVVSIYITEVILLAIRQNCLRNCDIHERQTRHGNDFNLPAHRSALFAKKPTYAGLKDMLRTTAGLISSYLTDGTEGKAEGDHGIVEALVVEDHTVCSEIETAGLTAPERRRLLAVKLHHNIVREQQNAEDRATTLGQS